MSRGGVVSKSHVLVITVKSVFSQRTRSFVCGSSEGSRSSAGRVALAAASRSFSGNTTVMSRLVMSVFPFDEVVRTFIVSHGTTGFFTLRPDRSCTAAGRLVSSLHQGAAHAGRCVQLVVQRAVGFFLHGGSVLAHGSKGYGE